MAFHDIITAIPGIFYSSSHPGAAPFKQPGDRVAVGEIVGLVEVMKSFQEVVSDVDGTVAAFAVENEGAVTAGQVVMTVERDL